MSSHIFPSAGSSPFWKQPVSSEAALPATGNTIGEVRVALDTDQLFEWDGSAWVEVKTDATSGVIGVLPVANGGTNSGAALNNDRIMRTTAGTIVEAAAITASRALVSDASGIPTHST